MANTKSAKKAIRVSSRKTVVNLRTRRSFKEARKDANTAAAKGDVKSSKELLAKAYKEIDKAAKKKVLHKNTAARYKSRLAKRFSK